MTGTPTLRCWSMALALGLCLAARDASGEHRQDAGGSVAPATDSSLIAVDADLGGVGVSSPASAPANSVDAGASDAREPPAWAPKLTATVKPASALVGDPIEVRIKIRHEKGISVNLPLSLELGKFSELSRRDNTREIGKKGDKRAVPLVERTFVLQVAAYELGQVSLPPVEVTALGPGGELITLRTPSFPIQIRSILSNEPNAKPRSLEPPVQVFQRTWWLLYLIIALAAVGLVVTVTLLVNRHLRARRERDKPPPPPRPAHLVALERLGTIDVESYIEKEAYKELYLMLSEIMRDYVGRRWGFDALEMTTTEIDESLRRAAVGAEVRQRLVTYFNECDLVKFAKCRPEAGGARAAVQGAEALVRQTAQIAAPRPPTAPGVVDHEP